MLHKKERQYIMVIKMNFTQVFEENVKLLWGEALTIIKGDDTIFKYISPDNDTKVKVVVIITKEREGD